MVELTELVLMAGYIGPLQREVKDTYNFKTFEFLWFFNIPIRRTWLERNALPKDTAYIQPWRRNRGSNPGPSYSQSSANPEAPSSSLGGGIKLYPLSV